MIRRPPSSPLFPSPPLFRSLQVPAGAAGEADLIHPDGRRQVVRAEEGMFLLPPLTRAGVYQLRGPGGARDRKSTRLNSSHSQISYAVFCLKKKKKQDILRPQ